MRGIPEKAVAFPPKMASIHNVGDLVQAIFQKHHTQNCSLEQILVKHWTVIIGNRYASQARPLKLVKNNTQLLISADNPLVRQELLFKKKTLLENIRSIDGCSGIKEITLCTG